MYKNIKLYPFMEKEFNTSEEALKVLTKMKRILHDYGRVSKYDLIELCDLDSSHVSYDNHILCWINLNSVEIHKINDKWHLYLPKPLRYVPTVTSPIEKTQTICDHCMYNDIPAACEKCSYHESPETIEAPETKETTETAETTNQTINQSLCDMCCYINEPTVCSRCINNSHFEKTR